MSRKAPLFERLFIHWRCYFFNRRCYRLPVMVCAWVAVLAACTPRDRADQVLENYRYRLSNVFELTATSDHLQLLEPLRISYPEQRQLKREIPALNINLLDFLRLSRCDLQRLLGERNSSLGMVMADSQRWLYEREFIQLAHRCIATLADDPEAQDLIVMLTQAIQHKQTHLAAQYWNATWGSSEFQTLFSLGAYPLTLAELRQRPVVLEQALQTLASTDSRWQRWSPEQRRQKLEQSLAVVGSEKYLGRLRMTMNLVTQELDYLSEKIAVAQARQKICPAGYLSKRGKVMETVFQRFYITEVQPLASYLHQRVEAMRSLLLSIGGGDWPQPLQAYAGEVWGESPTSEWGQFKHSVQVHTRLWQDLLKSCGKAPGSRP